MRFKTLFFVFLPGLSFAQPKGTNTIIVHPVTVESVIKNLEAMKFGVANDGFGTITTIPKFMESSHGHIQITIVVKDSTAFITGIFEVTTYKNSLYPADIESYQITPELLKGKQSLAGHYLDGSFKTLDDFAHSLKGGISYAKQ